MSRFLASASRPRPAKARNVLVNLTWCVLVTIVEVLGALELDGWLSVALWVVAARNVLIFTLALVGLAGISAEAINAERQRL